MEQSINFASYVQGEFKKCGQVDKGVRQAGFWVLAKTGMPAVLVELDFICNPKGRNSCRRTMARRNWLNHCSMLLPI